MISIMAVATKQHDLPPGLLQAVCMTESTLNPNAIHHDDGGTDSIGLCQVKLKTAKWLGFKGTANDLLNPTINAYYAAKYLRKQIVRYNGNTTKALIAYNRGNAGSLLSTNYSDKVIKQWCVLGGYHGNR